MKCQNISTSPYEIDASEGTPIHQTHSTLAALLAGCLVVLFSLDASAGPLDGRYVSNKSNQMQISGTRYTYIPREGTTNPKNVRSTGSVRNVGGNVYQFSGHLNYACTLSGTTLNCARGARIWYRG